MATLSNSVRKAEATLTAENTFTDWVRLNGQPWCVGVSGTFSATVTVQLCPPGGSVDTAADIHASSTLTAAGALVGSPLGGGWYARVGIKTGGFTSGTAVVGIYKTTD